MWWTSWVCRSLRISSRATQLRTERMKIRDLWIAFALSPSHSLHSHWVPHFCINNCLPRWQWTVNSNFSDRWLWWSRGQSTDFTQPEGNKTYCSPRWLWLAMVFISWGLVLLTLWLTQKCYSSPQTLPQLASIYICSNIVLRFEVIPYPGL